jgi:hypothetical protein
MLRTLPSRTRQTCVSSIANSRPDASARPRVRPFSTTVSPATIRRSMSTWVAMWEVSVPRKRSAASRPR